MVMDFFTKRFGNQDSSGKTKIIKNEARKGRNELKNYFYRISNKTEFRKMNAKVSIIMGSTTDWTVMQEAAKILDKFNIPFEVHALSAHRVPEEVSAFAKKASASGIKVIIAGAGGAAHLPGVVAAHTTLPVIGVPCKSNISLDGWDSLLSIVQMPPGIPVATVGVDAGQNAGILAVQILAQADEKIAADLKQFKEDMKEKVLKANEELKQHKFKNRTN